MGLPYIVGGVVANQRRPSPVSPTWHWLGLRYFWLLHGFLPALRPNGGSCPEIPGAACGEVSANPSPDQQTSMHRQASRNLGPTSNFPRIAEKEAGAKLHLGSICILLAA